jgi:erythromycin esterase
MHDILDWIRTSAFPIATVEAGKDFADLAPLRRLIGDARIVSLGEATRGTREFFQLKHRLLAYCVSELGFTIFAIEANFPECLRVNEYVLGGKGDAAEALAGMRFWTWDTEEVLALIEWMRAWNKNNQRQVKFYGFDMQFSTEAALDVLSYRRRVAPELADASEEPLWRRLICRPFSCAPCSHGRCGPGVHRAHSRGLQTRKIGLGRGDR